MASHLQTTWAQIRRTPYQALVAIMVMFLTFFAISSFTLISLGSMRILKFLEAAPQVIAFFEKGKDLTNEQIAQIRSQLEKTDKLASFKYVSTHEAEAIYKEKNKGDTLLLELVDYKILPPSIEVSAKNIDDLPALKDILGTQPGVKDVAFYEDIVQSLSKWIKNIRFFGIGLIIYLLLQSVLIILTITGMKIMARKEEIEILRLVGASNWFIRWPFVLEAMIYGVTGAFLGWGVSYVVLLYATPTIVSWLGDIPLLPVPIFITLGILGADLVAGILVGAITSLMAVHRFLRK
jgi:cell division transport system permease protein